MRLSMLKCVMGIGLVGCLLLQVGCATSNRVSLVQTGAVKLDIQSSKPFYVKKADVYQEDSEVVVKGTLNRRFSVGRVIATGHVDIDIADADGRIIKRLQASIVPRVQTRRATRHGDPRFMARSHMVLPKKAIVSVRWHKERHVGG